MLMGSNGNGNDSGFGALAALLEAVTNPTVAKSRFADLSAKSAEAQTFVEQAKKVNEDTQAKLAEIKAAQAKLDATAKKNTDLLNDATSRAGAASKRLDEAKEKELKVSLWEKSVADRENALIAEEVALKTKKDAFSAQIAAETEEFKQFCENERNKMESDHQAKLDRVQDLHEHAVRTADAANDLHAKAAETKAAYDEKLSALKNLISAGH